MSFLEYFWRESKYILIIGWMVIINIYQSDFNKSKSYCLGWFIGTLIYRLLEFYLNKKRK